MDNDSVVSQAFHVGSTLGARSNKNKQKSNSKVFGMMNPGSGELNEEKESQEEEQHHNRKV